MSARYEGQQSGGFDDALKAMQSKYGISDQPGMQPLAEPRPRRQPFDASARIRDLAPQYGFDPDFVLRIGRQESGLQHWRPDGRVTTSDQGAVGVLQVKPDTARKYGYDASDPEQNIRAGLSELKSLRSRFGDDPALILAGYHSGGDAAEAAMRNPAGNPKTHNYVRSILSDDDYNDAMSRYGNAAPRNSFDDVLDSIRPKLEPAGGPFEAALASVGGASHTDEPKQVYADDLPRLASEKYNGDETAATTDLFNQGYKIVQRVAPDDSEAVKLSVTDRMPTAKDYEAALFAQPDKPHTAPPRPEGNAVAHHLSVAGLVEPAGFDADGKVTGYKLKQGVTPEQFVSHVTEKGLAELGFTPEAAARYREQQQREPLTFRRGVRPEDTDYSIDELLKGVHEQRAPNTVYSPGQGGEPIFRFVVPVTQAALYKQFLAPEQAEQQANTERDIKQRRMEVAREEADPIDRASAVVLDAATGGAGRIADNPAAPEWMKKADRAPSR